LGNASVWLTCEESWACAKQHTGQATSHYISSLVQCRLQSRPASQGRSHVVCGAADHVHTCIIMVMYHHGHVSSWSCIIMVMFHHGHVSSWSCIFMVMYHHGHVSSWSCFIMVMYHHGHHKQADTRHQKTGTHQLRESGRGLQIRTYLSSVGSSPLCSLRL